jgi:tetratricopeptide (TPR) repeat protein
MASSNPHPRTRWDRVIPPAPPQRAFFSVLSSGNDAIDVALWQVLRDVLLWARTPESERHLLFDPLSPAIRKRLAEAADAAPLLADPLAALARLRTAPGEIPVQVAKACQLVTDWAERGGLLAVAIHFAEASAYADPMTPQWAVRAGYLCRLSGGLDMFARSEVWHSRSYIIAVRKNNMDVALRALASAGALMQAMGRHGPAWRLYWRAARKARRSGRYRQAAVALHNSYYLAAMTGHIRVAVRDANAALRYYPIHDERLPALAHDVAYLLVSKQHYRTALRLVDGLGDRVGGVWAMGMLYGITAWAAAGAGFGGSYFEASEAALDIARINDQCAGAVYLALGQSARILGRWEEAAEHASAALTVGRRRADGEVERLAGELVGQVERREPPPPASELEPGAPLATLARRLAARLRRWKGRKRSVRTQS